MRLSEEQEASVSQVVRSREDKRGMMGISCLVLPYLTRHLMRYPTIALVAENLYQIQNVCLIM